MALSKEDRIALSKKLVSVPLENKKLDESIGAITANKDKMQKQDNANKSIQLKIETVLNQYQVEIEKLDGTHREVLLESDIVDSVKRIKGNFLFPNDLNTPTPFLPQGIWKSMAPYTKNKMLGKQYNETYTTSIDNETEFLSQFNAKYSQLKAIEIYRRITGQDCVEIPPVIITPPPGGFPGGGSGGGGSSTFEITDDPIVHGLMDDLVTMFGKWIALMDSYQTIIPSADYDSARQAQNDIAKTEANSFKIYLQNWLAVTDYWTAHGFDNCDDMHTINESNTPFPVRLDDTRLDLLKSDIDSHRASFLSTRKAQVNTNLGNIDQTIDGDITSKSGLYGERYGVVNLRVNSMGGTLSSVINADAGINANNQSKSLNNGASDVYALSIKASLFQIPASNSGSIHVINSDDFAVGDSVYVYAEGQEELSGHILEKNGTFIKVDFNIPQKYAPAGFARLYKEL